MKKPNSIVSLFLSSLLLLSCGTEHREEKVNYAMLVNPFIGTDYTGNTYPGATTPFGMVQLSPDNGLSGWDRIAGYYYPDSTIAGFSHTHLTGTGAGDLYDISFMPVTNPYKQAEGELGIHSKFSHSQESAHAGYYQVFLDDYGINVELTATDRCGIQKYTFPEASSSVFLDLAKAMNWDFTMDSQIEVIDSCTIRGYRYSKGWANDQKLYFVTQFSRPFKTHEIRKTEITPNHGYSTDGKGCIARFDYDTREGDTLIVRTALSAVDYEGAMRNLKKEAAHNDFSKYKQLAENRWNEELGKVDARFTSEDQSKVFYTAVYHTMLAPTLYNDVDGRYRGADGKIYQSNGWNNYSTYSLWDTYRAAHPLYVLMHPKRTSDMMNALVAFGEQNGRLPVWNFAGCETDMMIGYHSAVVLAEAYLKGIGNLNGDSILNLCLRTANKDDYRGIGDYKKLGFVPFNKEDESLSKTMEYAYDDYAIAELAKKLNRKAEAEEMGKRAENYKNLFNPATGFYQPKNDKGEWLPDFNPEEYSKHITESNGWQYLWAAQHDLAGYAGLWGGKKQLESKLDSMFSISSDTTDLPIFSTGMIGQYAHGNEPSHHVVYLYNYTDAPYKTQELTNKIMREFYTNTPAGLCGNEDCGQMSAWYVFNALGFYPADPVSGVYELTSPLVESADFMIHGKQLRVRTQKETSGSVYIDQVFWNGKEIKDRKIKYTDLINGGELLFKLTDKSGKNF